MQFAKLTIYALTDTSPVLKRLPLIGIAQMAELVDAPASGAGDRKVVEVRVLFWAPYLYLALIRFAHAPMGRRTTGGSRLSSL